VLLLLLFPPCQCLPSLLVPLLLFFLLQLLGFGLCCVIVLYLGVYHPHRLVTEEHRELNLMSFEDEELWDHDEQVWKDEKTTLKQKNIVQHNNITNTKHNERIESHAFWRWRAMRGWAKNICKNVTQSQNTKEKKNQASSTHTANGLQQSRKSNIINIPAITWLWSV
jgi:hypothetical protein